MLRSELTKAISEMGAQEVEIGTPGVGFSGLSLDNAKMRVENAVLAVENFKVHWTYHTIRKFLEEVVHETATESPAIPISAVTASHFSVHLPELDLGGALNLKFTPEEDGTKLFFSGDIEIPSLASTVSIKASHDLSKKSGELEFVGTPVELPQLVKLLQSTEYAVPNVVQFSSGIVTPAAVAKWSPSGITQKLWLTMQEVAGSAYGASFSGGYGTIVGKLNDEDLELPPFQILIQHSQYGIAIQNIKSTLSAEAPKEGTFRASLGPSTGNTLDSTVQIGKVNFPPAQEGNLLVPVRAENLSLQKLIDLVPDSPVNATGYVDLELPIKIAPDGVSISSGTVRSRRPGGKIQYIPKEDSASALGDQYRLVAQALEDYEYTRLEADVELDPKGEMLIKARLSGTNKKLNKTRPIDVNVNIEQNLFKLLESIRMVRQFGQ